MLTIFSEDLQRLRLEVADLLLLDQSPETLCQSLFEILRGPLKLDFYFHFLVSEDETHLELAASGGDEKSGTLLALISSLVRLSQAL